MEGRFVKLGDSIPVGVSMMPVFLEKVDIPVSML